MKPLYLPFLLLMLLAACSKETDLKGYWKDGGSARLELRNDTLAIMGQEGIEGVVEGNYWMTGDTLWVQSAPEVGMNGPEFNTFTFLYRNDSLHLQMITLHRGGDTQMLSGNELAQRLGKQPEDLAFTRDTEAQ